MRNYQRKKYHPYVAPSPYDKFKKELKTITIFYRLFVNRFNVITKTESEIVINADKRQREKYLKKLNFGKRKLFFREQTFDVRKDQDVGELLIFVGANLKGKRDYLWALLGLTRGVIENIKKQVFEDSNRGLYRKGENL